MNKNEKRVLDKLSEGYIIRWGQMASGIYGRYLTKEGTWRPESFVSSRTFKFLKQEGLIIPKLPQNVIIVTTSDIYHGLP